MPPRAQCLSAANLALFALFSLALSGCPTSRSIASDGDVESPNDEQELNADCAPTFDLDQFDTLTEAFEQHFVVGVALASPTFTERDGDAAALVKTQYKQISPENVLKWDSVHPQPGTYNWAEVDRFVAFGEENDMAVIGHVLVWHQQTPDWVFLAEDGSPISKEALWARLEDHMQAMADRYGGRIAYWDVVNEAFNDDGTLRDSPWRSVLGDDYIAEVFALADELLPDSRLVYNDFSVFVPTKRDAIAALVRDLMDRGIRIDAVGMQGHYNLQRPYPEEVDDALTTFATTGIPVLFTELDLNVLPSLWEIQGADLDNTEEYSEQLNPYQECLPKEVDAAVADHWGALFDVFIDHADTIESITFWGVADGHSWLNDWPIEGRTNYPLLFDRELRPKSSFVEIMERVAAD